MIGSCYMLRYGSLWFFVFPCVQDTYATGSQSGGASNVDQVAAALAQMVLATWARIGQTFADVKLWKANGGVHMST